MAGRLEGIFVKRAHRGPMDARAEAVLDDKGLVGNANRGGHRQLTLIARERWDELMREVGARLGPETRRANLVLSGIDLQNSRGRILRVGAARIRIHGETRPCEQMEEAAAGLQHAMQARWGGGAYGDVLSGGRIAVGETAEWEEERIG
jgi:MOSC domain-containing protein YiiM